MVSPIVATLHGPRRGPSGTKAMNATTATTAKTADAVSFGFRFQKGRPWPLDVSEDMGAGGILSLSDWPEGIRSCERNGCAYCRGIEKKGEGKKGT